LIFVPENAGNLRGDGRRKSTVLTAHIRLWDMADGKLLRSFIAVVTERSARLWDNCVILGTRRRESLS
jgi:hypothetical protein